MGQQFLPPPPPPPPPNLVKKNSFTWRHPKKAIGVIAIGRPESKHKEIAYPLLIRP